MLARMQESWKSYTLLVGMHDSTAALENNLEVSYETKHTLII